MRKVHIFLFLILLLTISAAAQKKTKFSYAAQKKFIPLELGRVYLGMPFDEFAKQIDLKQADVGDTRFDWFLLTIPFEKGNIEGLTVKIHGLTQEDKKVVLRRETVRKKDESGEEYEQEVNRLIMNKIPSKGFVYAMYIDFKDDFNLKNYAVKTFGQPKPADIYKKDDEYRFYDYQWTKKTSDGLTWLIRSFHEGEDRTLQLLGRIEGTEWDARAAR